MLRAKKRVDYFAFGVYWGQLERSVVPAWPNFRRLEPKCNSKMTRQSKYRIMSEVLTSMVIV
jgi:hypothetical protein